MIYPAIPRAGDVLSADWGRRVVECLRALYFVGGPDLIISHNPNGVTANVVRKPGKGVAAPSQTPCEWAVSIDGMNAIVGVRPVVFAARIIPAICGVNEDADTGWGYYDGAPEPVSVALVDEDGVGYGDGFVYAEINLHVEVDTVTCLRSSSRPVDDPANSIVRWPLVHYYQTAETVDEVTIYSFTIDKSLHNGQLKIPSLFAS